MSDDELLPPIFETSGEDYTSENTLVEDSADEMQKIKFIETESNLLI
jgi:hypothetical protein